MIHYYGIDTETTGLKAGWHEVNQLSLIRLSDGFQKSWQIAVAHPDRVSDLVLDLQKITKADLRKGVSVQEAVRQAHDFIMEDGGNSSSRCFIGHNVAFDRRHAHAAWDAAGLEFPGNLWLCTKKFYKSYVTKVGEAKIIALQATGETKVKYGQALCLKGAGLSPRVGAHSAAVDVQDCCDLYKFLIDQKLNYVRMIEDVPHKKKSGTVEFIDYE